MPRPSAPSREYAKGFLKKRSDYLRTYKGSFARKELLVLYARANGLKSHRLGITAPKTIGSAVVRNKYKRWTKEIYRELELAALNVALDFNVLVGNRRIKKEVFKNAEFDEFKVQLREAFGSLIKSFK